MADINRIAGLILAAGGSARMGRPKQLLAFGGQTLIRRAALTAVAAEFSPIVIVLGDDPDAAIAHEVDNLLLDITHNPDWRGGIGTSIRAGMKSLEKYGSPRGVLITLCDQPLVTATSLRRLVETFSRRASGVVAAAYSDTVGVPAAFGPECFPELCALKDDQGAGEILRKYGESLRHISMPEAALDVDDPASYARLLDLDNGGR